MPFLQPTLGYKVQDKETRDMIRAYAEAYGELVREECAKVCDERVEDCETDYKNDGDERWLVYAKHARRLADFIRRKE